jgi:hypothetical protein
MTTNRYTTKRTTRISIRKVQGGYRVTGDKRMFRSHGTAFDAAWRAAARTGANLYAITPDGRTISLLAGRVIREVDGWRRRRGSAAPESALGPAADSAQKSQNSGPAIWFSAKSSELIWLSQREGDRTMKAQTETTTTTETRVTLDRDLRDFLKEVRRGECLALAAWAAKILRAGQMGTTDLERCFGLGF